MFLVENPLTYSKVVKLVLKLIIHYTCTALHTLKISFTNIKSSPMQSCGKCKYCDEETGCELVDLLHSKWLRVDSHLCLQVYFILFDTATDFHKWHNFYERVKKKDKTLQNLCLPITGSVCKFWSHTTIMHDPISRSPFYLLSDERK